MYDDVMHSPAADHMMEAFRVGRYAPTVEELAELAAAQALEVKGFAGPLFAKAFLSALPLLIGGPACAYALGPARLSQLLGLAPAAGSPP